MRQAGLLGVALLLAVGGMARAQALRGEAAVAVSEVEVRSGPSPVYYATGKLHQGDRVKIVGEKDGGWLAIEPPSGSFSWINTRFLDRVADTAVVLAPNVAVLVGSQLSNAEPTVRQVFVDRGYQVIILSTKKEYDRDGAAWVPILPPVTEVRYIPAGAVIKAPPPVQTATSAAPPNGTAPAVVATGVSTMTAADEALLGQAVQAERAGNSAEAERLYQQLARQTSDRELQMRCYNFIQYIHDGYRVAQAGTAQQTSTTYYPAPADGRALPATSTPPIAAPSAASAASQYTYQRDTAAAAPIVPPPPQSYYRPAPAPAVAPPVGQWSGPGWLRRTYLTIDSRPVYALESPQGAPRLYVTAQASVNLDSYVNRNVNLYGPVLYNGPLKQYAMNVSYVTAAQ